MLKKTISYLLLAFSLATALHADEELVNTSTSEEYIPNAIEKLAFDYVSN